VKLDLTSVPLTAELFGETFSRARGGTLFLGKIDETAPEVQLMLLRALEGEEALPQGVRIIASTDAMGADAMGARGPEIEKEAGSGSFSAGLLERLSASTIRLPALRDRRDDVGRLFFHFLRQELEVSGEAERLRAEPEEQPFVPAALVVRLTDHPWPGNVRQLRDVVRQIAVVSRGTPEAWISPQVEALLAP
jgi:two-component system nitrogen regulation response regulator GlnG